ncbi:hypothetical protein SK128_015161 [Halocaridina rubra]|uniref:EGF-like domain-containing protein n=1 Tax=Halocaridina rubra TaxID=373956 RepID=A0AAN8XFH8_HALRR
MGKMETHFMVLFFLQTVRGAAVITCQSQVDCRVNEYCESKYAHSCQCLSGFVREPGGVDCLPEVPEKGGTCVVNAQCSHLGLECLHFK